MEHVGEFLYCLVIAATLVVECLVIVWSVTSQRPRLVRAFVVWAAIALLLPARAYVPALVFAMTAALTWVLTHVHDNWPGAPAAEANSKSTRWSYQIADLLIVMLLLGSVISIYRMSPAAGYWTIFILPLLGLPLAPILAFSSRVGTGPYRARMTVATAIAIAISASILVFGDMPQSLQLGPLIRMQTYGYVRRESLAVHVALIGCLIACAGLAGWLVMKLWFRPSQRWKRWGYILTLALTAGFGILTIARFIDELLLRQASEIGSQLAWLAIHAAPLVILAMLSAMTGWQLRRDWSRSSPLLKRTLRFAAAACAILLVLPTAWLYWHMVRPLSFPPSPTSPENHYDRIVAISQELGAQARREVKVSWLPIDRLDEAVVLLRARNFVPTAALEEEARNVYPRRIRGEDLHGLTSRLCSAARDHASWGKHDEAADYCLAAIQFGEMFHRGGTAGLRRFGQERQFEAIAWLAENGKRLSASKSREIIVVIEQGFQDRDDPHLGEQREIVSWDRSRGWPARLRYALPKSPRVAEHQAAVRNDRIDADLRLISVQTILAIRAFEREEGHLPATLGELVPSYLTQFPQDLHGGGILIYRPAASDFELYSVGRDGVDNGGRFDPIRHYRESGFDLDLSWKDPREAR